MVLEAYDSHLQRTVAVKVLDPKLANDEVSRQRFCREARAAGLAQAGDFFLDLSACCLDFREHHSILS